MTDLQIQVKNLVKLANTANIKLADIETTLLQTNKTYKEQIGENVYSIANKL